MRRAFLFLTYLFSSLTFFAQTPRKQLAASRTTSAIKINGNLDEAAWKATTPATGFIESRPTFGAKENDGNQTEIFILYDNTSIYVGGYLHEKSIDSISKELVGRDKIGVSDFAGIVFDTYNDGINAAGFYVTPYGEQYDAKYSNTSGEDDSWNAVWESEAKIQADGWTFEMRIPYSALRFSSKEIQTWGLNMIRRRRKTGQQYSWNPVDPNKTGFVNQEGEWTGIEKIRSPLRLSFSPYFSTYINHYPYKTGGVKDVSSSVNGGMDVKYGISPSFTLDMTLVPDFGQVRSDNLILNLTPFEVRYNENRAFFTEGTELFNKGNLFYSRRVGTTPLHYYDAASGLNANEHILKNPSESKLVNATKISGRTAKGLGIGFFNAVTNPTYAIAEDNNGNKRNINTAPLTNYNILVLDQTLKNNSSVSFINTNVLRSGKEYDANVSAALIDIFDKKKTYEWFAKVSVSNLSGVNGKTISGYSHNLSFGKTAGQFNFNISEELADDKYDINDLGILYNNNYSDQSIYVGYHWNKPTKWYNSIYLNSNFNHSLRFKPIAFQNFNFNINGNAQLKNLWEAGFFVGYIFKGNDFYEPRVQGRFYTSPEKLSTTLWFNTNEAKKYVFELTAATGFLKFFNGENYNFYIANRYRFNDKFSLRQSTNLVPSYNNAGFADIDSAGRIIFSKRNRNTVENTLNAKYNFNKRTGITFIARHYWSSVKPKEFYTLQNDGSLIRNTIYSGNANRSLNLFNIDMVYTWQFAAGSFVNLVWKQSIYNDDVNNGNYFKNLDRTFASSQNNNLSLKIIYYLDYLKLRKKT